MEDIPITASEVSEKDLKTFSIDHLKGHFRFFDKEGQSFLLSCWKCENTNLDIAIAKIGREDQKGQAFRVICHKCGNMQMIFNMFPQQSKCA